MAIEEGQTIKMTNNEKKIESENINNKTDTKILSQNEKENTQSTNKTSNKLNTKTLTFWISLICVFVVAVQLILNYFLVSFETKIIIEVASFVLAFLVSTGVLTSSLKNKENIFEVKNQIEEEIKTQIKNKTNKK